MKLKLTANLNCKNPVFRLFVQHRITVKLKQTVLRISVDVWPSMSSTFIAIVTNRLTVLLVALLQ